MEIAKVPRHLRSDLLQDLLSKFRIEHIVDSLGVSLSGGKDESRNCSLAYN